MEKNSGLLMHHSCFSFRKPDVVGASQKQFYMVLEIPSPVDEMIDFEFILCYSSMDVNHYILASAHRMVQLNRITSDNQ